MLLIVSVPLLEIRITFVDGYGTARSLLSFFLGSRFDIQSGSDTLGDELHSIVGVCGDVFQRGR